MRLKRHVSLLESTLKRHASIRPLIPTQCLSHRRHYAQTSATHPEQIAILGGGIAGLSSAHFIRHEFPHSKITIFESGTEFGGWIKSRRVEVEGGEIMLEYGPRTLRPGAAALPTVQLIEDLCLTSDVLYTNKASPGARNRYVYYPDRLNALPGSGEDITLTRLLKLASSGILAGGWSIVKESWKPGRPSSVKDESVGDFISRRVDKRVADNLVSAVFHGIYAGDLYQLSAKTLLPLPWKLEGMYGSASRGFWTANHESPDPVVVVPWAPYLWEQYKLMKDEIDVDQDFVKTLSKQSTFYFKQGMQELPRRLEESLRRTENVQLLTETTVKDVKKVQGEQKVEIITGDEGSPSSHSFDFVVSTLPNKSITPSVSTMVVNLWFKTPNLVPVQGFGYLIPRSVPFEQNPERALGVIFDHDAVQGQDSVPGTKLTVMLGGHWWDGWAGYPDSAEGAEMAKSVIRRHLGITQEPDVCHVTLNENCIPQYTVGYEDRLKTLDTDLKNKYGGRLRVAGSQYTGVGVNDCIQGAWELAMGMRDGGWMSRKTGLERWTDERPDFLKPMSRMRKSIGTPS